MKPCPSCGPSDRYKNGQCKTCTIAKSTAYYRANPLKKKDSHFRNYYGISLEEYEAMLARQNGRCANPGCRTDNPGGRFHKATGRHWFYVDHDHASGKVRSLLCSSCNIGLGVFKENKQRLLGAVDYLHKHEAINETEVCYQI